MKRLKSKGILLRDNFLCLLLIGILAFSFTCCDSLFVADDEASINVSNQYGESLDIYFDGSLQFTLEYESESTIENVSIGEHSLEALKADTDDVVAATTIEIEDVDVYTWTIV